jgi:DNA-binding HxlR family transcriptional regulator
VAAPLGIARRAPVCHKPACVFDEWVVGGQQEIQQGSQVDPLGHLALKLVAQRWVIAILLELADGPLRPHELERRLGGLSHGGLVRRLSELSRNGVVRHRRGREVPPRAYYTLTRAGEELLTIADRAARWEEQTRVPNQALAGASALRVIADARTREILRELAIAPSGPRELGRRIGPVGHAALMRRLSTLTHDCLLLRRKHEDRVVYELTDQARGLATLAILAMGWERARCAGADQPPPSDLTGMLRLIAPLAVAAPELRGICRLQIDTPCEREASLCVRVEQRALTVLDPVPGAAAAVRAHAPLDTWLRALLAGPPSGLVAVADPTLVAGVLDAFATLLRAQRLDSLFQLLKIA